MLADLERLLRERSIDTVLVPMHEMIDPSFRWLSRGAKLTRGWVVFRSVDDLTLIHDPMERDEAAASGLSCRSIQEFDWSGIQRDAPDAASALARLLDRILGELGARETIAIFGRPPFHLYLPAVERLREMGWSIDPGNGEDISQKARKRKDPWEVVAVASVGARTEQVVDGVRARLRRAEIADDGLHLDGRRLTLGDLKSFISTDIQRLGMVEDHETIVSQGRDAGIPHSRGDASATVRASQPLVIDIFPADRATGYFFDMTRTFCVGPVPDRLAELHHQVFEAFEMARDSVRVGELAGAVHQRVCDYFESLGHPTSRSQPGTLQGYVHGLGHGVGLEIHERPSFSIDPANRDTIEQGDILTIEPGLYYPDEGLGVRIEDTLVVESDGTLRTLCRSDRSLQP